MKTRTTSRRRASIDEMFRLIRGRGAKLVPGLEKFEIGACPQADQEHKRSSRQYAHMNHVDNVICYAPAMEALAVEWKIGLIAHELGHAAAHILKLHDHTECDANMLGSKILGSRVIFKGRKDLEWARVPDWLEDACDVGRHSGTGS